MQLMRKLSLTKSGRRKGKIRNEYPIKTRKQWKLNRNDMIKEMKILDIQILRRTRENSSQKSPDPSMYTDIFYGKSQRHSSAFFFIMCHASSLRWWSQFSFFSNKVYLFAISHKHRSAIHSLKLACYVLCFFPMVDLSSFFSVFIEFTKPCFLIIYLRIIRCLFLLIMSILFWFFYCL